MHGDINPPSCYIRTVEGGGPSMVASAIGYNEYWKNEGLPLPCGMEAGCRAGYAIAGLLRDRLDGAEAVDDRAIYCAASYDKSIRVPTPGLTDPLENAA